MHNRLILSLIILVSLPVAGKAQQQPVQLSLKQAVDVALEPNGSTRIQLANEFMRQAEAQAAQARANLLPDISASVGQQSQTQSLTAFGLQSESLPEGFVLPSVVGPYNTFDARGTLTQKIFDISSVRRYQAARAGSQQAQQEREVAKDETAAEVARAYLTGVRAQAMVETAQANVELSESLLRLAESQKQAGSGTGIEITRARVQLANDRQQLLVAETQFTTARFHLLKALAMDYDVPLQLTDRLSYIPLTTLSEKQALNTARESSAQLKAQEKREERAALNHSATALERVPSIVGFADYGTIGLSAHSTTPTRTFGASIRIPVFDGGGRDARRAESASLLRQERIRSADLLQDVDMKIRVALDAVHSAEAQVGAAEEGLALSMSELEQARRRYEAGVATSVEITDAQTRLQRARDNRVSAIFNHALARIDLAAAMGTIQQLVNHWR
jgi:outer membrane protein